MDFDEATFPSVSRLGDDLQHWNWVFEKTPKFKIVKSDLVNGEEYRCELNVVKGRVEKVDLFKQNVQLTEHCMPIVGNRLAFDECETSLNDWLRSRTDFQSIYLSKLILDTIRAVW